MVYVVIVYSCMGVPESDAFHYFTRLNVVDKDAKWSIPHLVAMHL